jgi:hypothetical protein
LLSTAKSDGLAAAQALTLGGGGAGGGSVGSAAAIPGTLTMAAAQAPNTITLLRTGTA